MGEGNFFLGFRSDMGMAVFLFKNSMVSFRFFDLWEGASSRESTAMKLSSIMITTESRT